MKAVAAGCGDAVAQPAAGEKCRRDLLRQRDRTFIALSARPLARKDPRIGASRSLARAVAGAHPFQSL